MSRYFPDEIILKVLGHAILPWSLVMKRSTDNTHSGALHFTGLPETTGLRLVSKQFDRLTVDVVHRTFEGRIDARLLESIFDDNSCRRLAEIPAWVWAHAIEVRLLRSSSFKCERHLSAISMPRLQLVTLDQDFGFQFRFYLPCVATLAQLYLHQLPHNKVFRLDFLNHEMMFFYSKDYLELLTKSWLNAGEYTNSNLSNSKDVNI